MLCNAETEKVLKQATLEAFAIAKKISIIRREVAKRLEADIVSELHGLYMENAQFAIQFETTEALLETGIEIIAQPPGKKLQSLSLLSGGERAFTAIALLFAILEVKPVPFCLLDEVEAALDEANVARYGRYLKEFTNRTQFIVITHRRGTMEEADVLYGVTMQESGVSKLASVKFEDFDELEEVK